MAEKEFDYTSADSQGTAVKPMKISNFNISQYEDYEAFLLEGNGNFWKANGGVRVCA